MSFLIIVISSVIYTNKYIDKKTEDNIIQLEKKYSKVNLNSMNVIITASLSKIQSSLNELISAYQNVAKKVKENDNIDIEINNNFFKNLLDLTPTYLEENLNNMEYIAYWFIDEFTNEANLKPNSTEKKQVYSFSNIMPNLYSTFSSTNSSSICYYFYFDSSEIFISYPLIYDYESEFLEVLLDYEEDNKPWCTDEKGNKYKIYKAKCRDYYVNSQIAKTTAYDFNSKDFNNSRTIFVTEFYQDLGQEKSANIYTMCIEFKDPLSGKNAYSCADIGQDNLINNFDEINSKLFGYFLVTLVGFNHAFYFPQMIENSLTPTEAIFTIEKTFYLEEKTYFQNYIQKLMTSNYMKQKTEFLWDEIYINGENDNDQYFYFNGERNYFSIIPIYLENLEGNKEHVLSIVYIYNPNYYHERIFLSSNGIDIKLFSEIIIFIICGAGLLYLILLSFEILAKYIVIPIKNVNYMLKGINIGGNNRLEYLSFLKKKQDENIEMYEKMNIDKGESNKNNNEESNSNIINENQLNKENSEIQLNDNNDNINDVKSNEKDIALEVNDEKQDDNTPVNRTLNFDKKIDEDNDYIEQEMNFYNFDENLLQNRPLEIDQLIKALLDLKDALIVSSTEQKFENIINYLHSSDVFNNFKNQEAMDICQSNTGNLQSQLHKYDKAIYHLALSLQDKKLKKFLNKNLIDELDEGDFLLDMISSSFSTSNKNKKNKINDLVQKQANNTSINFPHKIIANLINSRYNKLIFSYFNFFSLIQKYNNAAIEGNFMNTSFHTINYYNKVLIQYIYLSYVKNDLIKIGESILNYIEFLMKFKLKTSPDNIYLLNIHKYNNKDNTEDFQKEKYKKKIFDKIMKWFCLFDDYVSHIRNNTSLTVDKSIARNFTNKNISDIETNSENQTVFLFKVNVQKSEFLKGKLALYCHQYNDALFYFIRAARKKSIVLDGLIKKKSMKRILKIMNIFWKKYKDLDIIGLNYKEKCLEYEKIKYKNKREIFSTEKNNIKMSPNNNLSFGKELQIIKKSLIIDLEGCNAKQEKDIAIIIDFNIYNFNGGIINQGNLRKLDSFLDQTKVILEEYLSNNDRLATFIFTDMHQIICPLTLKNNIDINNFSKDLDYYRNSIFHLNKDEESLEVKENSIHEINNINIDDRSNYSSEGSQKESLYDKISKRSSNTNIIQGLINSINYSQKYFNIKQSIKNEKYIILFSDLFSIYKLKDGKIRKIFDQISKNKEISFLFVGKNENDNNEDEILNEIIKNKFNEKSEIIYFENMKKIGKILSNNIEIKDEIYYPNEIYKY